MTNCHFMRKHQDLPMVSASYISASTDHLRLSPVTKWGLALVDDFKAAMTGLKDKKIKILSEEPRIGAHGKPVVFLHPKDCDGVLVELEEAEYIWL
ncbi:hypothetical protein XELAEV_18018140mg [Xenopus laevis]|uniref:VOC domain-containing protein n=1 Tax=Xenopus laevis TaxID=8355 RepID=A0A974DCP0_XENLA|nr:hypothetical protein XELAEV_18018140mg [Xenopus laevis]